MPVIYGSGCWGLRFRSWGLWTLNNAVYHQFRGSSCRKLLTTSYDYVAVGAGLGKLSLCF